MATNPAGAIRILAPASTDARASRGAEEGITAIGNWLLGSDDQVGCVVLSAVDAAEERLRAGSPSRGSRSRFAPETARGSAATSSPDGPVVRLLGGLLFLASFVGDLLAGTAGPLS